MTRRPALALALVALLVGVAGCGAADESSPSGGVASFGPDATLPDIGESLEPETTEPASTSISGFDGWSTINPGSVVVGDTEVGLAMSLTKRATWSGAGRGVLFYAPMDGDFRISATVRTTRTSDSSQTPGADGTTQLAGLMARREGSQENWVFVVVGGDATRLTVETASTRDATTRAERPGWNAGEAELKLCRIGSTFTLWKRAADSDGDWVAAATYERKDMAGPLQVGATILSDSPPDITASFDNLTLEPIAPGEAC